MNKIPTPCDQNGMHTILPSGICACGMIMRAPKTEIEQRADEVLREIDPMRSYTEAMEKKSIENLKEAGRKYDGDKSPVFQGLFQYFPRALKAVADISKYGAGKYNVPYRDKNWERVDDAVNRYGDALSRHILDHFIDGHHDPESTLRHFAHVAWNALAVLEMMIREGGKDAN